MADWMQDMALAAAAAVVAGRAVMGSFGADMEVSHKAPDQPLTLSDLEADRILHERLMGARPEYGWLSEETADDAARLRRERVWLVDPIDGTRSFIAGRREFSISIGVAELGIPMAGVVLNPSTGELYATWRGGGAWKMEDVMKEADELEIPGLRSPLVDESSALSPATLSAWTPIRVRDEAGDRPTMLASRSEIAQGEFEPFPDAHLTPLGSTAYKLAKLAEGAADVFLSRGPKSEWDLCAGALLVREAGGIVTDLRGEEVHYNRPNPAVYGVLAASVALHRKLLRRIAELPPSPRLEHRAEDVLHPGLEEDE